MGVSLEEESAKVKAVIETALQSILEQSGSSIGSHELRRIAQLEDVKYLVMIPSRGDEDYDYYNTIDCSQLRHLARQELIRPEREPIFSVLQMHGIVMYPQTVIPLTVGLPSSIKLVDDAFTEKRDIAVVASKDPDIESPNPDDLYEIGTLIKIHRILRWPDGTIRILVQGLSRIEIEEYVATDPYLEAKIRIIPETVENSVEVEALMHNVITLATKLVDHIKLVTELPDLEPSMLAVLVSSELNFDNPIELIYTVAKYIDIDLSEAQKLLELDSTQAKLQLLGKILEEKIA
jgi:ATP-dependent Lon protease